MYIAQQIAAHAVASVLGGRNLTLALPEAQAKFKQATPQQRGGGADLSYGTLRFYGEVNAYLKQLLEKPLRDAHIHALLAVAVYQLLHDKAEDFTVVNQAVKAASASRQRWAKGLVNGVLRNFLRRQTEIAKTIAQSELAKYSYPQWWIARLKKQYPQQWQAILEVGNAHPPMTLRVNQRQTKTATYLTLLARHGIEAEQIGPQAIMLKQAQSVHEIVGFDDGVVSVQDYGAQLTASLLDLQTGQRVLDACAAPGGKTSHILETADVDLTAIDHDAERLDKVSSNLDRLGLTATLAVGDASNTKDWYDGKPFDRILADVPCSASGIVRRHVDIKWLRRNTDIQTFVKQQRAILDNLWQLLAKGGKLLYVTCSIFEDENQHQIKQFIASHSDAKWLPIDQAQYEKEGLDMHNQQLIPNALHDGLYYALLQKN